MVIGVVKTNKTVRRNVNPAKQKTMQNKVEVLEAKSVENSNRVLSGAEIDVREQVEVLREHFPHLRNPDFRVAQQKLPHGATAWVALPMWQCLAPSYHRAVLKMVLAINHTSDAATSYGHFQPGEGLVVEHLMRQRLQHKTEIALQRIHAEQGFRDIVVVAAQFGESRHVDRTIIEVRRAMRAREFGLGIFHVLASYLAQMCYVENDDMVVAVGDHDGEFLRHENSENWACCLTRRHDSLDLHWKDGDVFEHQDISLKHATGFRW